MPAFGNVMTVEAAAVLVERIHAAATVAQDQAQEGIHDGNAGGAVFRTEKQTFKVEVVSTGYEVPWSLVFLSEAKILVAERAGRLRIVDVASGQNSAPIHGLPKVWSMQDGGLLSIALDPKFSKNGWIYLSYADPGKIPGTSMTKIVRGRIRNDAWTNQQVVWQADPKFYYRGSEHYGCRLLFVGGKLFFTVGERGNRAAAQDLSNPCGKIHRVEPDGKIPADNPFVNRAQACPSVWSYGHRNPQGLALDPLTGELWSTEHGPRGGDELNIIRRGGNYGWPVVTFGAEETGEKITNLTAKSGMVSPVYHWTPSLAVCPLMFSTSEKYPAWKHDLLVGSLAVQQLHRLALKNDTIERDETLIQNLGRIRDLVTGPDGLIYIAVEYRDRPGEIVHLVPQ